MKNFILLFLIIPFLSTAQKKVKTAVHFEENVSIDEWNELMIRSKQENKFVLVEFFVKLPNDTYKPINTDPFSQKPIADFVNEHFISIRFQYNQTSDKKAELEKSRPTVKLITDLYPVNCFPGYLILDTSGQVIHRFCGYLDSISIIKAVSAALNNNDTYYTLITQFNNGNRAADFFKKLFNAVKNIDNVDKYLKAFIQTRDDLFTEENANILINSGSESLALEYLYSNKMIWQKIADSAELIEFYKGAIQKQFALKEILKIFIGLQDYRITIDDFAKKYPDYGKSVAYSNTISLFIIKKDVANFKSLINELNDSSFVIFNHPKELDKCLQFALKNIDDTILLNKVLIWGKINMTKEGDAAFFDTYASLLYKLNKKNIAIEVERKAIALAIDEEKKQFKTTLSKMEKGKEIW